jgi:hypothetical protein
VKSHIRLMKGERPPTDCYPTSVTGSNLFNKRSARRPVKNGIEGRCRKLASPFSHYVEFLNVAVGCEVLRCTEN